MREPFAAGQNARAAEHQRLVNEAAEAEERYRQADLRYRTWDSPGDQVDRERRRIQMERAEAALRMFEGRP